MFYNLVSQVSTQFPLKNKCASMGLDSVENKRSMRSGKTTVLSFHIILGCVFSDFRRSSVTFLSYFCCIPVVFPSYSRPILVVFPSHSRRIPVTLYRIFLCVTLALLWLCNRIWIHTYFGYGQFQTYFDCFCKLSSPFQASFSELMEKLPR